MTNIENIFDDIFNYILSKLNCEEIGLPYKFIPNTYCSDFDNCEQCKEAIKEWCFSKYVPPLLNNSSNSEPVLYNELIVVWNKNEENKKLKRYFYNFNDDGLILTFPHGQTKDSYDNENLELYDFGMKIKYYQKG